MTNLKDIWTVAKFTMKDLIGRKSFRISTIIILLLIIVGFNVPNFLNSINGGDFSETILISDPENVFDNQLEALNTLDPNYKYEPVDLNADEIKAKLEAGDASSAVTIEKPPTTSKSPTSPKTPPCSLVSQPVSWTRSAASILASRSKN